jgi:hypothetical protein
MNRLLSSGNNMRGTLSFQSKVSVLKFWEISIHAVALIGIIGALYAQQQPLALWPRAAPVPSTPYGSALHCRFHLLG